MEEEVNYDMVAEIPAPKAKDPRSKAKYNPLSRVFFW